MSKQALVVYNPTAQSQVLEYSWITRLVSELSHRDKYVVTLYPTNADTKSEDIVALLRPDLDLVVAAGGDGTIRCVLAALARAGSDIPAAVIPLGTGNVLARNLGIVEEKFFADSLAHAFDPIVNGVPVRIDMGLMNGHYFSGIAGAGPLSDAFFEPAREAKTSFKLLAYIKALLHSIAVPPVIFRVTVAGRTFEVEAAGIFVGNVQDLGLGKPCELRSLTDGEVDLHVLDPKNFSEYVAVGFRFVAGKDRGNGRHYVLRVKEAVIEALPRRGLRSQFQRLARWIWMLFDGELVHARNSRFIPAMIDGEVCGTTPMHITVAPKAVTVLVPASRVKEEEALCPGDESTCHIGTPSDYQAGELTGFITAAQVKAAESK